MAEGWFGAPGIVACLGGLVVGFKKRRQVMNYLRAFCRSCMSFRRRNRRLNRRFNLPPLRLHNPREGFAREYGASGDDTSPPPTPPPSKPRGSPPPAYDGNSTSKNDTYPRRRNTNLPPPPAPQEIGASSCQKPLGSGAIPKNTNSAINHPLPFIPNSSPAKTHAPSPRRPVPLERSKRKRKAACRNLEMQPPSRPEISNPYPLGQYESQEKETVLSQPSTRLNPHPCPRFKNQQYTLPESLSQPPPHIPPPPAPSVSSRVATDNHSSSPTLTSDSKTTNSKSNETTTTTPENVSRPQNLNSKTSDDTQPKQLLLPQDGYPQETINVETLNLSQPQKPNETFLEPMPQNDSPLTQEPPKPQSISRHSSEEYIPRTRTPSPALPLPSKQTLPPTPPTSPKQDVPPLPHLSQQLLGDNPNLNMSESNLSFASAVSDQEPLDQDITTIQQTIEQDVTITPTPVLCEKKNPDNELNVACAPISNETNFACNDEFDNMNAACASESEKKDIACALDWNEMNVACEQNIEMNDFEKENVSSVNIIDESEAKGRNLRRSTLNQRREREEQQKQIKLKTLQRCP